MFQETQSTLGISTTGMSFSGFRSSTPDLGAEPNPDFCASMFVFSAGQKPNFGGTGSASQQSGFGSMVQESQPTFGISIVPTVGMSSGIGSSIPSFGAAPTPGVDNSMFVFTAGQKPIFEGSGLSASHQSPFGSTAQQILPTSGISTTPAVGKPYPGSGSPMFVFSAGTKSTFGGIDSFPRQSSHLGTNACGATQTLAFGTTAFGSSNSCFGTSVTSFGVIERLGLAPSVKEAGGTRIAPYAPTPRHPIVKLVSISAMPEYKDRSHEELRWEDYKLGYKGEPVLART
ncbi:unnamed protein product [Urochloa humidicola]